MRQRSIHGHWKRVATTRFTHHGIVSGIGSGNFDNKNVDGFFISFSKISFYLNVDFIC
jgi:hypothetical protein